MDDIEKFGTGHHEASHAAVALLLGAAEVSASLERDGDTWSGDNKVTWGEVQGPARKQKIIQVAVAGPLGQVKYRAGLCWPGATFDRSACLRRTVGIVRKGKLDDQEGLTFRFFTTDCVSQVLEISDYNDFGDFEMLKDIVKEFDDETLLRLFSNVQECLDSPEVWAAVGDMAEVLFRKEQLLGQEAVAILRQRGLV